MDSFKKGHTFEKRVELCRKIVSRFENTVPIIVEPGSLALSKRKFLVDHNITVAEFIVQLKKFLPHNSEIIFLLSKETTLLPINDRLQNVYQKYKDDDGFLYITLALENSLGPFFPFNIFVQDTVDKILHTAKRITRTLK